MISVVIDDVEHCILVEFSDHCFTDDPLQNDTRPRFTPCSRTDGRFCAKRHKASLNIWEHINHAMGGWVWLGEDDRCLILKLTTEEAKYPLHYVIPFTLERWKGDKRAKLKMRVRSAFIRESGEDVATFGRIKFASLVKLTVQRKSPGRTYDRNRIKPW
jgi:hypothetical protein